MEDLRDIIIFIDGILFALVLTALLVFCIILYTKISNLINRAQKMLRRAESARPQTQTVINNANVGMSLCHSHSYN